MELNTGAHLRCNGKGRKERITPLTGQTCGVLRTWLAGHQGDPDRPLYPSRPGGALNRDAIALLVARHSRAAEMHCPSLGTKTVTPHVLRHTCAMRLLAAGVDTSVIALGSATRPWKPLRSTYTPISASRNEPLPAMRPRTSDPDDIEHPTAFSPSSKGSDYADCISAKSLSQQGSRSQLGIIRCSA